MNSRIFGMSKYCAALVSVAACSLFAASEGRAALLFDNMTVAQAGTAGTELTSTGSTPNTFMGDGYTLLPGASDITGFDVFPVNGSGTNYTNLKISIYVWGSVNTGTVSAAAPAFSNLLGSYSLTSAGTFTTGFYFSFTSANPGVTPGISLGTPLVIPTNNVGITLAFQGSTDGINYASANSLTSIISADTTTTSIPPTTTAGAEDFNGYYRNAASETNGNFTSTLRSLGLSNQSVGLRVYGDVVAVPEPVSISLLVPAVMLLGRRRRRAVLV